MKEFVARLYNLPPPVQDLADSRLLSPCVPPPGTFSSAVSVPPPSSSPPPDDRPTGAPVVPALPLAPQAHRLQSSEPEGLEMPPVASSSSSASAPRSSRLTGSLAAAGLTPRVDYGTACDERSTPPTSARAPSSPAPEQDQTLSYSDINVSAILGALISLLLFFLHMLTLTPGVVPRDEPGPPVGRVQEDLVNAFTRFRNRASNPDLSQRR
eukprot:NODE_4515_length_793_cov_2.491935_g3750_i0.p1 GENE.NODE_4515_length_793_cov_2.491935_g3750_i0~~NODE_4515_length_793_cov_2.491935_g3750_i0.p1  ORF type:complete len:237 (-),score=14.18 NODE_4515_length_793_cov_2.491935_g3750_i0:81-713(-)